jgi:S-DNA-T family DNA segregation ATPase FtsK/SpoIIIE
LEGTAGLSELEEDGFMDEGPVIHEDNEDLEVFRPIVPPLKMEDEGIKEAPTKEEPEKSAEELPELEDLDFTFKVAEDADVPEEEDDSSLAGQEIKANDLVKQFGLYDPTAELPKYQYPTIDLLKEYDQKNQTTQVTMDELKENKEKIVETLLNYGIGIQKI